MLKTSLLYLKVFLAVSLALFPLMPSVVFSEEEGQVLGIYQPNDPYYSQQWYLNKIKAPEAWRIHNSSQRVVVAVIDGVMDIDHPDLRNNIWKNTGEIADNGIDDDRNGFIDDVAGWNFVTNFSDVRPQFQANATEEGIYHGTIIASIIAAEGNNGREITGITWAAQVMPLVVLDEQGGGKAVAVNTNVIRAIDYAIQNKAGIINLSFAGLDYSPSLEQAIRRAYNAGIIIVAAAGNEKEGAGGKGYNLSAYPIYPACYDDNNMVIGVAGTDALDQKVPFSNYGHNCVDIAAPAVSFYSLAVYRPGKLFQGYVLDKETGGFWDGTSMATAVVSGGFALIKAVNPKLGREEAIAILLNTADDISILNPNYLGQLGQGRLNLSAAVRAAKNELFDYQGFVLATPQRNWPGTVKTFDPVLATTTAEFEGWKNFRGGINAASGDIDGDKIEEIIVTAGASVEPKVKIFNQQGKLKSEFFAFPANFRGGVNVAVGDIDGNGVKEIVVGAAGNSVPYVKIFNGQGKLQMQFLAYDKKFLGGVNISCGDINGDGSDEIITGAGPGGGPQVRIFDRAGRARGQFFAYASNFRGGANVATGDADGDGSDEIITGAGPGGGPQVRIFDWRGRVKKDFFAYASNFRGGANVATGDVNQDGIDEIITGAGPGGGPHIRVFDFSGAVLSSWFAYSEPMNGGVKVGFTKIKLSNPSAQ